MDGVHLEKLRSANVHGDRAEWEKDPGWGLEYLGQVWALLLTFLGTLASE